MKTEPEMLLQKDDWGKASTAYSSTSRELGRVTQDDEAKHQSQWLGLWV